MRGRPLALRFSGSGRGGLGASSSDALGEEGGLGLAGVLGERREPILFPLFGPTLRSKLDPNISEWTDCLTSLSEQSESEKSDSSSCK